MLNNCEQVQYVLLLNAPDFTVARGAPMIRYLTRFLRDSSKSILDKNVFENIIKVVVVKNEIFDNR